MNITPRKRRRRRRGENGGGQGEQVEAAVEGDGRGDDGGLTEGDVGDGAGGGEDADCRVAFLGELSDGVD